MYQISTPLSTSQTALFWNNDESETELELEPHFFLTLGKSSAQVSRFWEFSSFWALSLGYWHVWFYSLILIIFSIPGVKLYLVEIRITWSCVEGGVSEFNLIMSKAPSLFCGVCSSPQSLQSLACCIEKHAHQHRRFRHCAQFFRNINRQYRIFSSVFREHRDCVCQDLRETILHRIHKSKEPLSTHRHKKMIYSSIRGF